MASSNEEIRRAIQDAEQRGLQWRDYTEEYLIGYLNPPTGRSGEHQNVAIAEMQRRLLVAIRDFNAQSGAQAETMIRLTRWIIGLTWALGAIAGLQLWAMLKGVA